MSTKLPSVPESCSYCPYIDQFHSSCTHPFRQIIIEELDSEQDKCPLFDEIRAEAMRDLEISLDE